MLPVYSRTEPSGCIFMANRPEADPYFFLQFYRIVL